MGFEEVVYLVHGAVGEGHRQSICCSSHIGFYLLDNVRRRVGGDIDPSCVLISGVRHLGTILVLWFSSNNEGNVRIGKASLHRELLPGRRRGDVFPFHRTRSLVDRRCVYLSLCPDLDRPFWRLFPLFAAIHCW